MLPDRKFIRLQDHDYRWSSPYFITICTFNRRCVFGRVRDSAMQLNGFGRLAHERWLAIPEHHPHIQLDEFIVMPNHVHGILHLESTLASQQQAVERHFMESVPQSISTVVGSYKSGVTRRIGEKRGCKTHVWQPRFYDHIVRVEDDLDPIRLYILNNPAAWEEDRHNPANLD